MIDRCFIIGYPDTDGVEFYSHAFDSMGLFDVIEKKGESSRIRLLPWDSDLDKAKRKKFVDCKRIADFSIVFSLSSGFKVIRFLKKEERDKAFEKLKEIMGCCEV